MVSTRLLAVLTLISVSLVPTWSTDNDFPNRSRRFRASPASMSTSVDHLKAVARVATGVYLTQELIKGTDKQEEVISELLKMGSVKPSQIINMKENDVQKAIGDLKVLPTTLNIKDELRKAMDNAESAVVIKNNYANVSNIIAWPEKDTIKTILDDIARYGANDTVIRNVISNLKNYDSMFIPALTEADKIAGLLVVIDKLIVNIPLLTATVQFSNTGRATDHFSRIRKIVLTLQTLEKIKDSNLQDSESITTLDTFFGVASQVNQVADDVKNVNEVIKTRHLPGSRRQLHYSHGVFQGQDDLSRIQSDLNDHWMMDIVNSSSFEKSMHVLKKLEGPLRSSDSKFGNFDEHKIATFSKFMSESQKFAQISLKRTDIETALVSVRSCLNSAVGNFDEVRNVTIAAEELDNLFVSYRAKIQQAIQKAKNDDIINKLTSLKTELEDPANPGKTLNQMFPNGTGDLDKLYSQVGQLVQLINDVSVKDKCRVISSTLDTVESSLANFVQNVPDLKCIADLPNLDLVEDFVYLLKSSENANNPSRPDYQKAISIVTDVKSTSVPLGTVLTAVDQIKGATTKESKGLDLLENSSDVSDKIGNAVRGVAEIQKAVDAVRKMVLITESRGNVTMERLSVSNNLSSEEISQLKALESLDFTTLTTELNAFKTAVESKPLVNLQDSSATFEEAKRVNGIQIDLTEVLIALDTLITLSANSQKLNSMRSALADLRDLQLDFTSFHQYYDPAKTSMGTLETFFSSFSASMLAGDSLNSIPIVVNPGGNSDGGSGLEIVSGGESDEESGFWNWIIDNTGRVIMIIIAVAGCLLIVYVIFICVFWTKNKSEMKELDEKICEACQHRRRLYDDNTRLRRTAKSIEEETVAINERAAQRIRKIVRDGNKYVKARQAKMKENMRATIIRYKKDNTYTKTSGIDAIARINFFPWQVADFVRTVYNQVRGEEAETEIKARRARYASMSKKEQKKEEEEIFYTLYFSMFEIILRVADIMDRTTGSFSIVDDNKECCRSRAPIVMETRVAVEGCKNDFLHANEVYIDPFFIYLIVLQGPIGSVNELDGKVDTCEKTWKMYLQRNVTRIAMLTQVDELASDGSGRKVRKCAQYFPNDKGQTLTFGEVTVDCISCEKRHNGNIIIRHLKVKTRTEKEGRIIVHYQYVGWPVKGVPTDIEPLIWLLREVQMFTDALAVHCSTGDGRSGVFCFLLLGAQQISNTTCNLFSMLIELRKARAGLIQTTEQFAFCVKVIVPYMLEGASMDQKVQDMYDELNQAFDKMAASVEPRPLTEIIMKKPDSPQYSAKFPRQREKSSRNKELKPKPKKKDDREENVIDEV